MIRSSSVARVSSRVSSMDAEELRVRLAALLRINAGRMAYSLARPKWDRRDVLNVLDAGSAPLVSKACTAMVRGDAIAAHRELSAHLASRASRWPLRASNRERLAGGISRRFPAAAADARHAAERIVDGRIDLLGYRDLPVGNPPIWNQDPVHLRQAPLASYWADVAYLDPSLGDHKVIWELNRHQHFLMLGTAFWLTGNARYRAAFVRHLEDWCKANRPLAGVNWASSLELAFRAMAWTWAAEFFAAGAGEDTTPWLVDLLVALDRQLTHVADNLSTYFSPNTHLTGEALALYAVSTAFPELRRSAERASIGRDALLREADRQIRGDGGHAELSAHYHRYSTDFYLLACQVARAAGDPAADAFEWAARRQAVYLRTIADDAGRLPLIGDDDGGRLFRFDGSPAWDASSTLSAAASVLGDRTLAVSPTSAATAWILGEPDEREVDESGDRSGDQSRARRAVAWPSRLLADSGYFVSRSPGEGHLVFDAGPHGFLNGGHAHSDALSVVLTVLGLPLLVDPGTATYTMDPAVRDRYRAARMHNTIVFDGQDPSEPAGPFHWRTRGDARFLVARTGRDFDFAVAALAGRASTHMRAVLAIHGAGWLIVDRIGDRIGKSEATTVDTWWHLHPMWTARPANGGVSVETVTGVRLVLCWEGIEGGEGVEGAEGGEGAEGAHGADVEITRDPEFAGFAPEYGRIEIGTAIRVRHRLKGPLDIATFVPSNQVPNAECEMPKVRCQRSEERGATSDGWERVAIAVSTDASAEMVAELAFPDDPETQTAASWPEPRVCLRRAQRTTVCVE